MLVQQVVCSTSSGVGFFHVHSQFLKMGQSNKVEMQWLGLNDRGIVIMRVDEKMEPQADTVSSHAALKLMLLKFPLEAFTSKPCLPGHGILSTPATSPMVNIHLAAPTEGQIEVVLVLPLIDGKGVSFLNELMAHHEVSLCLAVQQIMSHMSCFVFEEKLLQDAVHKKIVMILQECIV